MREVTRTKLQAWESDPAQFRDQRNKQNQAASVRAQAARELLELEDLVSGSQLKTAAPRSMGFEPDGIIVSTLFDELRITINLDDHIEINDKPTGLNVDDGEALRKVGMYLMYLADR